MKISIIGYKNHAIRLRKILKKIGYDDILNFNHHVNTDKDIKDVDVFFISSPSDTHMGWIEKLSIYNKYIFCEKPPVTNLEDLDKIKNYRDKLYFNFNYRFSYLVKVIEEYNITKELGVPIHINCFSTHGIAFKDNFKKNWRFKSENIFSSITANLGIHYIDLISYLFGPIKNLDIKNLSIVSSGLADTSKITIDLNHCLCDIVLSYAAPFTNKISILYDNGIIELSNGIISVFKPRNTFDKNGLFIPPEKKIIKKFKGSRSYYDNALYESIKYFIESAKNNIRMSEKYYNQSIESNKILLDFIMDKN